MRKITLAVATMIIFGALTIALPKLKSEVQANPVASPAAAQIGPDTCRNVKFKFTNMRSDQARIWVDRIEYWVASKQRWQVENIATSTSCTYGSTCTTGGDNLRDALDRDLTKFHIVYRYMPNTVGANWSSPVKSQELTPDNPRCSSNRTYGPGTQGWRIPPQ